MLDQTGNQTVCKPTPDHECAEKVGVENELFSFAARHDLPIAKRVQQLYVLLASRIIGRVDNRDQIAIESQFLHSGENGLAVSEENRMRNALIREDVARSQNLAFFTLWKHNSFRRGL